MDTQQDQDLQAQINILKSELTEMRLQITLLVQLISRHGFADPRITQHDFEILDRLHALDGK